MPLSPGTRLSAYEIVGLLGAGGMGEVYRARDTRLDRDVAIKVLPEAFSSDPDRLARFQREAKAAAALNHPNICTIYEVGASQGVRFIAMELIDGRSLRELVASSPVPIETLVRCGCQIADALAHAHRRGIIHRDLKEANIVLDSDGNAKVLDFGLAKRSEQAGQDDMTRFQSTGPGGVVGTLPYMAPELLRGELASARSDLWALGVLLYRMASGRLPFEGRTQYELMTAIVREPPPPLPQSIPPGIRAAIHRCLSKEPERRYERAEEVRAALESVAAGLRFGTARHATHRQVADGHGVRDPGAGVLSNRLRPSAAAFVGREAELRLLEERFREAQAGAGSMVSVHGEPGIGKTALVKTFLARCQDAALPHWVAIGRCSVSFASTEPYLPLLEAIESLLSHDHGRHVEDLLMAEAPTWSRLCRASSPAEESAVAPRSTATSQEGMKREFARFVRRLTREQPLLLFLDDVHWADTSTTDLLAYLGDRLDATALLVVVTYRDTELLLRQHGFLQIRQELETHGLCHDLPLDLLDRAAIERYISHRFPDHRFSHAFVELVSARTEGNPLFMVDLLRYLTQQRVLVEQEGAWAVSRPLTEVAERLPFSARSMIERKLAQVGADEEDVLLCASVQGPECDSTVIAEALSVEPVAVERHLRSLDKVHAILEAVGRQTLPDGAGTVRYRFVHALYQERVLASLDPGRRTRLCRAVAERLQFLYRGNLEQVASQLGLLYHTAEDFEEAAAFHLLAARIAATRFAARETVGLAERALKALGKLPASAGREKTELECLMTLVGPLTAVAGFAAPRLEQAYSRAHELTARLERDPRHFFVLFGLGFFYFVRAKLDAAQAIAGELRQYQRDASGPVVDVLTAQAVGSQRHWTGEFQAAVEATAAGLACYDVSLDERIVGQVPLAAGVALHSVSALSRWMLGQPDRALVLQEASLDIARRLAHPPSLVYALSLGSWLHQFRQEPDRVRDLCEKTIAISTEEGFSLWLPIAHFLLGWTLTRAGEHDRGLEMMRKGKDAFHATGARIITTWLQALLAESLLRASRLGEAQEALDVGFAHAEETSERHYAPELHRIQGEVQLAGAAVGRASRVGKGAGLPGTALDDAQASFERARDTARAQGARILELRALVELANLELRRGRRDAAYELLAPAYASFAEGLETPDLKAAAEMIAQLCSGGPAG